MPTDLLKILPVYDCDIMVGLAQGLVTATFWFAPSTKTWCINTSANIEEFQHSLILDERHDRYNNVLLVNFELNNFLVQQSTKNLKIRNTDLMIFDN